MKETTLYDNYGEPAAISVNLDDVAELVRSINASLDVTVHHEDYDDYGSKHYVQIKGICADILISKNYGGMFCPADYLECSVSAKRGEDSTSVFEYLHCGVSGGVATSCHTFAFSLKQDVKKETVSNNYEQRLKAWLMDNLKYLCADSALFYRVDNINYPDLRGDFKWGNGITSFDAFRVSDDDFYVHSNIKDTRREKLSPSFEEIDIFSEF